MKQSPYWALGLLLALLPSAMVTHAQTSAQITIQFDCKGQLLGEPLNQIDAGQTLQVIVDANCPEFKREINTFIQSLEKAKSNLSGTKYYEWEALFKAYGFDETDRRNAIQRLNDWIVYFKGLSNGEDSNLPPRTNNEWLFQNRISFDCLYYLEYVNNGTTRTVDLKYYKNKMQFQLCDSLTLEKGQLQLKLHHRDIEKWFLELAYKSLPAFNTSKQRVALNVDEWKDAVNKTKDTFSANDAKILENVWEALTESLDAEILDSNKLILSNLLWLSQGRPTINIMRMEQYDGEEMAEGDYDSIAYYEALIKFYDKFRDGTCLCDLIKMEIPGVQCNCVANLLAEARVESKANEEELKKLTPGTHNHDILTQRNKVLEKIIATYVGLESKCICTDGKTKHPYRPSLEEIAGSNYQLKKLQNKKAKYEEYEAEEKKDAEEKKKTLPQKKERWLADASFFVSEDGKAVWMRHHNFQRKMGLMSPLHEMKNEYLENQAVTILTHNVPIGRVVNMHESVEHVKETTALEDAVSEPLATILGAFTATAVDRRLLEDPNGLVRLSVNADNYQEVRKALLKSLGCLRKEFDFDSSVPNQFPLDDSTRYYTDISQPQATFESPAKITYNLTSLSADKSIDSSSSYTYRRSKLRRVTPAVIIGISSVRQYEYVFANNQIKANSSAGVVFAAGLNVHIARINLRNPYVAFSKKGRAYDHQPNFDLSRISLFASVSLTKPLRDFYLAPSIDICPGLGIMAGLNIFVQDVQRLNGNTLETFDYKPRYGLFAAIAITPSIFTQIFPNKTKGLPLFYRSKTGKKNGVPSSSQRW